MQPEFSTYGTGFESGFFYKDLTPVGFPVPPGSLPGDPGGI